jgi:hypothetical protein
VSDFLQVGVIADRLDALLQGKTRSFGDAGSMSRLPESGQSWAIYEYAT